MASERRRGNRRGRLLCITTIAVGLIGGLAACGSDDAGRQTAQADAIAGAKAEGRREALNEERLKDAASEAKKLQAQINALKKHARSRQTQGGGATSATASGSSPAPYSSGTSSCGDGLSVNSVTTCPFARNVRAAYERSGGATTLEVDSPVTGRTYTMRCSPGIPTVCSGGDNAKVYIR